MELNPNHRVTSTLHDHWHAVALMIMRKMKLREITITSADIDEVDAEPLAICAEDLADGLHIKIVTMEEGERLARREGGLPV